MQTLEEKKALLQMAMDDKKHVYHEQGRTTAQVIAIGNDYVFLRKIRLSGNKEEFIARLDCCDFRIVEPRITPEDLCEAVEKQEAYRRSQRLYCEEDLLLWNLTKRYREQESKTTNEVSEAGE